MDEKHPNRKKDKHNPYTLMIVEGRYYLSFKDARGVMQNIEIDKVLYELFNRFELEDISYLNRVSRHIEHSELTEASLNDRAFYKAESLEETVALLSKLDVDKHIDVEIKLDELDLTSAESKATYAQIKEYVLEKFGLKVSTLYIAQIKKKCGIEMREHYNKSKKDNQAIPQCTPEKEEAIMDALRHFKMI